MKHWLVVFAEEREIDKARLAESLKSHVASGRVTLLKTGVGKVRSAMEVNAYLTGALRQSQPRPKILNVGTCASLVPGLDGKLVSPQFTVDRDATPDLLQGAGLKPQPILELESFNNSGLIIGTGDGFVADEYEAYRLREQGISLVDMETHAVAWAAMRNLSGRVLSLRYVTDVADNSAMKDWSATLIEARLAITNAIITLTTGGEVTV